MFFVFVLKMFIFVCVLFGFIVNYWVYFFVIMCVVVFVGFDCESGFCNGFKVIFYEM